jgi:putative ABC transport system substrate-binding protein
MSDCLRHLGTARVYDDGRRKFLQSAATALMAVRFSGAAQGATKPRIGLLTPNDTIDQPFWEGMHDLGYVEGKNIIVDRRSAGGDFARLPDLAADLVKVRPDVIVAIVSAAAIAARQATTTIPIVMAGVSDPFAAGLVGNLAHPGGNVTGTSSQSNAVVAKQIELIRQVLPKSARVVALWNPANAIFEQLMLSEALGAGARLGLLVRVREARTREELDHAFAEIALEPPDAVLILSDAMFVANARAVGELGLVHRMPVFSGARPMAEAGALAIYGPDQKLAARRAAVYVQRILNGAKPGDLAIELPTKFELVINLQTAQALGLTVPPAALARADYVIR